MRTFSQSLSQISQGLLFLHGHLAPPATQETPMNLDHATPADAGTEFDFAGPRAQRPGYHVVSEQWFGPAVEASDLARHRSEAAKLRLVDRRTAAAFDQG